MRLDDLSDHKGMRNSNVVNPSFGFFMIDFFSFYTETLIKI